MKKGIELEYFTIDSSGQLCKAEELTNEFEFAHVEFAECIIEIKSEPHEDIDALRRDVEQKLEKAVKLGRKKDIRLVPLGTPLNHDEVKLMESERLEMMKKFNPRDIEIEKELARIGLHIHFEKENVKDQLNILTALDPAFATVNSSPYHKGQKVASSSRNWIYRYSWEPDFPKSVELWHYTDSVEEWKTNMHSAFEEFKEGAIAAGIDEEKFMKHHHPDRSIWTPIRLRDQFPTIEYRSPDTTTLSSALKLVEDLEHVLEESKDKEIKTGKNPGIKSEKVVLPEFSRLKKLSREAARKGLNSEKVREYLEKMEIDIESYRPLSDRFDSREEISMEEACDMRIKAAEILEEDLGL